MPRLANRHAGSSHRISSSWLASALGLLLALALAAPSSGIIYTYNNTTGGAVPTSADSTGTVSYSSAGAAVSITDDGYNGTQASMACKTIAVASQPGLDNILGPVTVSVSITHTFVGHLTIKLFSPTDSFTLMSRPGAGEAADNGTGGGTGDNTNIAGGTPVSFAMASGTEAENMGGGLNDNQTVCLSGGACSFNPNNGASTLSENLADLNGDSKVGNWTLCVGDSIAGDTGTLGNWSLNLGTAPTISGNTGCDDGSSSLNIPFTVAESFTVSSIALGLNVSHAERGDLRATLAAPGGSTFNFIAQSADTNDDFDIQMSTNTEGALNDGTADPVGEPYYARLATVAGANFYVGSATGTWTLRLCDRDDNAVTGTLNRARLVLTSADVVPNICTSTIEYQWEDNGNNVPFTNATVAGVTITLTSTRDLTNDGADTAGRTNFTTQQGTFGNEFGYYIMQFDDGADGNPQSPEAVLLESSWSFDPPVRYQTWRHLDVDNGSWEDFIRVTANDSGGVRVPYSLSLGPVHQLAGDIIETDGANVEDTSTDGNVQYNFEAPVASLVVEYMRGDDDADPNSQRIGMGSPGFCAFDFGDAPDTYGTLIGSNGARHVLGLRQVYLGTNPPDGENDGQPLLATQDDTTQVGGVDDEDGMVGPFTACPDDTTYAVTVAASNLPASAGTAYLVGYIDWSRDGDFNDVGEQSATVTIPQGNADPSNYAINWSSVPDNCGPGGLGVYVRYRISTNQASVESPIGQSPDGEVEDYRVADGTLPVTIAHVASERTGGQVQVRWTTATETLNAGFRIWGVDGKGQRTLLGKVKTQNPDSFVPQSYEALVAGKGIVAIEIEDVGLVGENRLHGPFAVGSEVGEVPADARIDWTAVRQATGERSLGELAGAASDGTAEIDQFAGLVGGSGGQTKGLLLVRDEGIQRITHENLLAAGINLGNLQPGRIAVTNHGVAVPRYISTTGGRFGPGSYIEFVAKPQLTLASPVDVYVIEAKPAKALPAGNLIPGAGSVGVTIAEDAHRADALYSYSAPNGDPWYEQGLLAWGGAASLTRGFDLPDLAAGGVELDLGVWGYGDWAGTDPDHHVVVTVNGTEVLDERFDGITPLDATIDLTGLVNESGNVLEVRVPGDTGYLFDYTAYDGFTLRYPRSTVALGERFQGAVAGGGSFAIGGFAGDLVSVWNVSGATALRGQQMPVGGEVVAPAGGTVYAASLPGIRRPGVVAGIPAAKSSSNAQYVIVTHPAFAGHLANLEALQQAKGLSTEVVTVDRIFAAYSDHAASADAIKSFLTASAAGGNLRYVLMVGADTTDPYDHLGLGSVSFVPTAYLPYAEYVAYSPTDETLVDADGDGVGEVPIGRLPVRTPEELSAFVAKLATWEENVGSINRGALFVAGDSNADAPVTPINESYAATLTGWTSVLAPVEEYGTAVVRDAVLEAMNVGTPLVSYVGHSSPGQWDNTPILRWQDVAGLTNAGYPNLVVQWGCWNSYYVNPDYDSLSAYLLRQPNAGAAGTIGAMTRTSDAAHQALGILFFQRVAAGAPTVGDAFRAAKLDLAAQGGAEDALLGMALLGDPAMSLPPIE